MRVTPKTNNAAQETESKRAGKSSAAAEAKEARKAENAAKAGGTDAVKSDISAKAKEFSKARSVANDAPDVRESKIAELKQRIAEGRYKVDADAVADKLVNEHMADIG